MTECYQRLCHNKAIGMIRLANDTEERPVCKEHLDKLIWISHGWREIKRDKDGDKMLEVRE